MRYFQLISPKTVVKFNLWRNSGIGDVYLINLEFRPTILTQPSQGVTLLQPDDYVLEVHKDF